MPLRVTQRSRDKQTPRVTRSTSRDVEVTRVVAAGGSLGRAAAVRGGSAGTRGSSGPPAPCSAQRVGTDTGTDTGGGLGCVGAGEAVLGGTQVRAGRAQLQVP